MDIEDVRAQFPFIDRLTYFNHGSIAPLSVPVQRAMQRVMDSQAQGTIGRSIWRSVVTPLRQKIAALINASPQEIAIVRNTVEGLSTVAAGVRWREGDVVVANDMEFPANIYPWLNLKPRYDVETKLVPSRDGRVLAEDLIASCDKRTRLLTISFVQFSNGFRADLETLGAFCQERGIDLCVDGIQGVGPLTIDVRRCRIDYLACGGHKWLLGPIGIGFLYVRKGKQADLWPSEVGHLGVEQNVERYRDYRLTYRDSAEKYEGGVHNYIGAAGMSEALDLFHEVGPSKIAERIGKLTDQLCEGLIERGYRLLSPRGANEKSGTVSFISDRHSTHEVYHRLMDAGVYVTISEGAIRVAPHFYNTEKEIDRLLGTLAGAPVVTTSYGG